MHFCFIFRSLEMGGIQTLMMRMANWLIAADHRVTILAAEDGSMHQELPPPIKVIVDRAWYHSVRSGGSQASARFLRTFFSDEHVDVFYCFSDEAIWIAAGLLNAQPKPARCLGGIYGPSDYGIGPAVLAYPRVAALVYPESHLFLHHLPEPCRIYMSSALRKQLEAKSNAPVGGHVWPLPVEGSRFATIARQPEPGLIVSVGRLTPMKDYNLWMVDVIAQLRASGLDVRWEVYGEGPYRVEMEARIRTHGLENHICLKGEIKYEELGAAFSRAQMFVGMGTALIEAGFAGVPAIAATPFEMRGMSYGFLHELPEYTCGEPVEQPMKPVADLIRQVLALHPLDYAQLSEAQRRHAARFDMPNLMTKFLELVDQSPQMKTIWRPSWHVQVATLYRKLRKLRPVVRPKLAGA